MLRFWPLVLLLVLVSLGVGFEIRSTKNYPNCGAASPTQPCVEADVELINEYAEFFPKQIYCATTPGDQELLVSDAHGYQLLDPTDLTELVDVRSPCSYMLATSESVNGHFVLHTDYSSLWNLDGERCFCAAEGANCVSRVIQFKSSSGNVFNTTAPVIAQRTVTGLWTVKSDVVDAPLRLFDCRNITDRPFPFENTGATYDPNAILVIDSDTTRSGCPYSFISKLMIWVDLFGYGTLIEGGLQTGQYEDVFRVYDVNVNDFNMIGEDQTALLAELYAGHTVTASYGPSFVSTTQTPFEGTRPLGFGVVDPTTGVLTKDSSTFESSGPIFAENTGRSVLWAAALEGQKNRISKIEVDNIFSPVYTVFEEDMPLEVVPGCPAVDAAFSIWRNPLTNETWPIPCYVTDHTQYPFAAAFSDATQDYGKAASFFTEGTSTYCILAYSSVSYWCESCFFTKPTPPPQVDIWNVTETPTLVFRALVPSAYNPLEVTSLSPNSGFHETLYRDGWWIYTNQTDYSSTWLVRVDSSGLDNSTFQEVQRPVEVPSDAFVWSRQFITATTLLVNYARYGSVIYNFDPILGVTDVNQTIPSFANPANYEIFSGAQWSCGSESVYRTNSEMDSTISGGSGYILQSDLEAISPFATPSPSAPPPSPSAPAPSPSVPAGSVVPSASAIPPPPPPPCPDTCMYDCTYIEPSKLPKPSVKPSKQPAATKVPEPSFFIIELTYESAAADCGPDCCEVREWLGDDTVAASFYMCSEDSQTKNRAPEYDDKAGTCSIFLAAQEGSDPGQISQAEFDAAVATLEGNFATLCTDAKNCDASTQSGKSASYIIGGGAGSVVASVLLVIAAVAALL